MSNGKVALRSAVKIEKLISNISNLDYRGDFVRGCSKRLTSREEAFTARGYYPSPIPRQEATNMRVKCLVYNLVMPGITLFVAKTADCTGVRGEGSTVEEALQSLVRELACRVLDKVGGVYSGCSSHEFQLKFFEPTVEDWAKDGVKVSNVTCHEVVIFSE
jgi:hypothetical protein